MRSGGRRVSSIGIGMCEFGKTACVNVNAEACGGRAVHDVTPSWGGGKAMMRW